MNSLIQLLQNLFNDLFGFLTPKQPQPSAQPPAAPGFVGISANFSSDPNTSLSTTMANASKMKTIGAAGGVKFTIGVSGNVSGQVPATPVDPGVPPPGTVYPQVAVAPPYHDAYGNLQDGIPDDDTNGVPIALWQPQPQDATVGRWDHWFGNMWAFPRTAVSRPFVLRAGVNYYGFPGINGSISAMAVVLHHAQGLMPPQVIRGASPFNVPFDGWFVLAITVNSPGQTQTAILPADSSWKALAPNPNFPTQQPT
jgi:hypothetical protein